MAEPFGRLVEGKKNWKPEKWGEYCTQNGFEMFEVILSYLSNTMSFLRVGGFVLSHAGMMLVVMTLMESFGKIGQPIVLIFGNAFVMVMEGMIVAIQIIRLEFYEIFSRFYEGNGKPFAYLFFTVGCSLTTEYHSSNTFLLLCKKAQATLANAPRSKLHFTHMCFGVDIGKRQMFAISIG